MKIISRLYFHLCTIFILISSNYIIRGDSQLEGGLQLRLVGGSSANEGRVEIFHDGQWGTICDDLWDDFDARVVCRELGISDGGSAVSHAAFGEGLDPIWLDNVQCIGTEDSLVSCLSNQWGEENCGHAEDAGVICIGNSECNGNTCDNGGTCIEQRDGFVCTCLHGFTGDTCQDENPRCNSNICDNGGICIEQIDGFVCICLNGFTGDTCQNVTPRCNNNTCDNGGTCIEQRDGFICTCLHGFRGDTCQYDSRSSMNALPLDVPSQSGTSQFIANNRNIVMMMVVFVVLLCVIVISAVLLYRRAVRRLHQHSVQPNTNEMRDISFRPTPPTPCSADNSYRPCSENGNQETTYETPKCLTNSRPIYTEESQYQSL